MEDQAVPSANLAPLGEPTVDPVTDFRCRARKLLHAHRETVRRVESELSQQVRALLEEVERTRASAEQRERELLGQIDQLQHFQQHAESAEETQQQLDAARTRVSSCDAEQQMDDLRRRFEMAVQEVRELKSRNAELTEKLAGTRSAKQPTSSVSTRGFDWEAQKRRLVEQLESDFDETDSQQAGDKLTVEGTIRITDHVVAEKEKEIEELKKLLDDQSSNIGNIAIGAAAVAEILDRDELIREERENLKRLQEESRGKLRQAEIDISLERAKLARERVRLEEKVQSFEAERSAFLAARGQAEGKDESQKPPRGRWLARLGLKDDD